VSGGGREERADVDQVQVHFRTLLAVVANEKPWPVLVLFGFRMPKRLLFTLIRFRPESGCKPVELLGNSRGLRLTTAHRLPLLWDFFKLYSQMVIIHHFTLVSKITKGGASFWAVVLSRKHIKANRFNGTVKKSLVF